MAETTPQIIDQDALDAMKKIPLWKKILRQVIIALVLIFMILLCYYLIRYIIELIPEGKVTSAKIIFFGKCLHLSAEQRIMLLVALGGALGAFIHISTSFVDFLGNKNLILSWIPWYLMRPFIGAALAIIFYLVLRGGLFMPGQPADNPPPPPPLERGAAVADKEPNSEKVEPVASETSTNPPNTAATSSTTAKQPATGDEKKEATRPEKKSDDTKENENEPDIPINPYGILAVACMVGLFSKNATDKLREVFETLFKVDKNTVRLNPLFGKSNSSATTGQLTGSNPQPVIDDDAANDLDDLENPKG